MRRLPLFIAAVVFWWVMAVRLYYRLWSLLADIDWPTVGLVVATAAASSVLTLIFIIFGLAALLRRGLEGSV